MIGVPDKKTDSDTVGRVLQGDILVPYIFLLYLDSVLQSSIDLIKENSFT